MLSAGCSQVGVSAALGDPQTLRSVLVLEGMGIVKGLPVELDLLVEMVKKSNLQNG